MSTESATILFADVVGSTELSQLLSDAARARELLEQARSSAVDRGYVMVERRATAALSTLT